MVHSYHVAVRAARRAQPRQPARRRNPPSRQTVQYRHLLIRLAAVVMTMALVQDPMRLAADVLIWRHVRRVCPQLFDGPACAAAVAACLDEYRRELALAPAPSLPGHAGNRSVDFAQVSAG
jgi:hypothetical protein